MLVAHELLHEPRAERIGFAVEPIGISLPPLLPGESGLRTLERGRTLRRRFGIASLHKTRCRAPDQDQSRAPSRCGLRVEKQPRTMGNWSKLHHGQRSFGLSGVEQLHVVGHVGSLLLGERAPEAVTLGIEIDLRPRHARAYSRCCAYVHAASSPSPRDPRQVTTDGHRFGESVTNDCNGALRKHAPAYRAYRCRSARHSQAGMQPWAWTPIFSALAFASSDQ